MENRVRYSRWGSVSVLVIMGVLVGFTEFACSSKRRIAKKEKMPMASFKFEEGNSQGMNEPVWAAKRYQYNPSVEKVFALQHTRLEVRFDWQKQYLYGKATIKAKPFFYPQDSLFLNAKGMVINTVAINHGDHAHNTPYKYYNDTIRIKLDKTYTRNETVEVLIDYIARPNEIKVGGSDAISSDKGLYFINPDGKDPFKPRQIWTQGETQASSCWFPTIDAPNQRMTHEILMTVDNQYKTLSNGILVSTTPQADGTRIDHWKMEQAHAPYLVMMAVGDFAVTKDQWRGKEVSYYVEPEYEPYTRLIFGNTPEMLEFYSNKLGVDYPWAKYAQVVVRDFVSGAMENTTATVHMEGLQHDARAHLDESHEDYISHELFHQWFGDYVTTESWANLPLNESFATYGEYLWREYKYGRVDADHHLDADLNVYLAEAATKREPLIRYYYNRQEDMFDGHSYQKGGRVLHMLRQLLGDEAFFAGIKLYLTRNAMTDVEIAELRIAMEDASGKDLMWFFDQWFMSAGHPELTVRYDYDPIAQTVAVKVIQTQDLQYAPLYRLPVTISVTDVNGERRYPVTFYSIDTTFYFPAPTEPLNVDFDAEKMLLADIDEYKSNEWYLHQLKNHPRYKAKQIAIEKLGQRVEDPAVFEGLLLATNDSFWAVRLQALQAIDGTSRARGKQAAARAVTLATHDPKAAVRSAAVEYLASNFPDEPQDTLAALQVFEKGVQDSSYAVTAHSLEALYKRNAQRGLAVANTLKTLKSDKVRRVVADILMNEKSPDALHYTIEALKRMHGPTSRMHLLVRLGNYLLATEDGTAKTQGIEYLKSVANNPDQAWYIRFSAVRGLLSLKDNAEVRSYLIELKAKETNEQLKSLYERLITFE